MGNPGHGQLKGESMNELNYASLEASKKLHDAGIILETDAVWEGKEGQTRLNLKANCPDGFPAPSMAEVWRELPETMRMSCRDTTSGHCNEDLRLLKDGNFLVAGYGEYSEIGRSENPTDALIDLLMWVKEVGK